MRWSFTQQNERRIPVQLQVAVEKEVENSNDDEHIERSKDDVFIEPTLITV